MELFYRRRTLVARQRLSIPTQIQGGGTAKKHQDQGIRVMTWRFGAVMTDRRIEVYSMKLCKAFTEVPGPCGGAKVEIKQLMMPKLFDSSLPSRDQCAHIEYLENPPPLNLSLAWQFADTCSFPLYST